MKKILLIGGKGYIGSILIGDFTKDFKIKSLDFDIYSDQKKINFKKYKNVEFVNFDLRNSELLDDHLKDVDFVVILAGLVGEFITKKYPKLSKEINEDGIINLINKVEGHENIEKLIFISTCSNYGKTYNDVLVNEDHILNPLSPYAKAKVKIEEFLLSKKNKSFSTTILRFATAFGCSPRMRFDLTVNHFCYSMFKKQKLEVFDPDTWRPYCHVKDFSRLISKVLTSEKVLIENKVFNAGSDQNNFSKRGIVNLISKKVPNTKIVFKKDGVDSRDYRVSFKRVEEELGFKAKYNVDYGIDEIINLLKNDEKKYLGDGILNYYGNFNILDHVT